MNKFREIFKAELNKVIDNHSILLTVIIAPLLYSALLGTIYIQKDIEGISFAIIDADKTPTTMGLTRLLSASPKINVKYKIHSYEEAIDLMYKLLILLGIFALATVWRLWYLKREYEEKVALVTNPI